MDGAELAMNVDWAADDADVAMLWALDALAAYVGDTGRNQGHSALMDGNDGAEASVAVVCAAQMRGRVGMAKPKRPVGEHHATINRSGLPRALVVVGEEGSELVTNYQLGHEIF